MTAEDCHDEEKYLVGSYGTCLTGSIHTQSYGEEHNCRVTISQLAQKDNTHRDRFSCSACTNRKNWTLNNAHQHLREQHSLGAFRTNTSCDEKGFLIGHIHLQS